jgi:hypothetical protein
MNDQPQERPFGGFTESSGYDGGLQDGSYYNATLTDIKEVYIEKGQWPGWKVQWDFAIDGTTETVRGLTSQATGPDSTAGQWLPSLVGKARFDNRKEQKLTTQELVGRECLILVAFNDKGWPRVSAVLPRQVTPAPVQPVPVAAVPPPPAAPGPAPQPTTRAEDFDDLPF